MILRFGPSPLLPLFEELTLKAYVCGNVDKWLTPPFPWIVNVVLNDP